MKDREANYGLRFYYKTETREIKQDIKKTWKLMEGQAVGKGGGGGKGIRNNLRNTGVRSEHISSGVYIHGVIWVEQTCCCVVGGCLEDEMVKQVK